MALTQSPAVQHSVITAGTSVNVRRWSIVGLLTVGVIVAYIDRVNLSVAVIDDGFKSAFQLSARDRGLATSAFFSSYAALQIPAGWLVDRYGSKKPYAVGYLVWSLLCAATALVTGFTQLLLARLLLGIGEAVMHVYFSLTWLPSYLSDAHHLSLTSSSLYTTFSFAGMATVGIIGGWAADRLIGRGYDAVTVRRGFTIAGFLIASTELIGANTTSLNTALFFSIFSLSGLGLATANYWALTQTLVPGAAVGRIVGIQNTAASLPGIVAPILTGWLVQRAGTSYESAMWMVFAFLLIGVASYAFLVRRTEPQPRGAAA